MYTYEHAVPLVRYSPQSITADTTVATIDMSDVHVARAVLMVGAVSGTVTARVYVNTTNSLTNAVQVTSAARQLTADSTLVYAILSETVASILPQASYVLIQIDVDTSASATVGVDVTGVVARYAPRAMPTGFEMVKV